MNDAIDTVTGKRILAQGAQRANFTNQYLCPVCEKSVILAAPDSEWITTHFKHHVGEDHTACERYKLSCGGGQNPFAEKDNLSRAPRLVCGSGSQGRVYFGIRYLLKASALELTIEPGGKTARQPINNNAPVAWIKEPAVSYKLCIHYSDSTSRTFLVDGFQGRLRIFNASSSLGVLLPERSHLRPGNYYLLHQGGDLKLPTEFHLVKLNFLDAVAFHNWSIFKFEIPTYTSDLARTLFLSKTNYLIEPKTVSYALLQPATIRNLGDDDWQVEAHRDWAILIKFPHDDPEIADIYIQRRTLGINYESKEQRIRISDTGGYLLIQGIASEATEGTLYRIAIKRKYAHILIAELSCVSTITEPKCNRLGFVFDGKRVLWSSHKLPQYLSLLRQGKKNLSKIEIPDGISLVGRANGKEHTILCVRDFIDLSKSTRTPISLQAEGHGRDEKNRYGIILVKGVALKQLTPKIVQLCHLPLGDARRAEGYMRGQVSEYAAGV